MRSDLRVNLHTHSIFDDGKDEMEDMVKTAIEKGFSTLGFSGHSPNPVDTCSMSMDNLFFYQQTFSKLKAAYGSSIDLYCGLELDSLSPITEDAIHPEDFDYIIASVHYIENAPEGAIDESRERFVALLEERFGGDIHAFTDAYYKAVREMIETRPVDIVGHIDLISKYNEDESFFSFEDPIILAQAMDAVQAGIEKGVIFEMNTGAISRGYRSLPYPHPVLFDQMVQAGAKFCINTDCHNREKLDESIALCMKMAVDAGLTHLYAMDGGRLVPFPISRFKDAPAKNC